MKIYQYLHKNKYYFYVHGFKDDSLELQFKVNNEEFSCTLYSNLLNFAIEENIGLYELSVEDSNSLLQFLHINNSKPFITIVVQKFNNFYCHYVSEIVEDNGFMSTQINFFQNSHLDSNYLKNQKYINEVYLKIIDSDRIPYHQFHIRGRAFAIYQLENFFTIKQFDYCGLKEKDFPNGDKNLTAFTVNEDLIFINKYNIPIGELRLKESFINKWEFIIYNGDIFDCELVTETPSHCFYEVIAKLITNYNYEDLKRKGSFEIKYKELPQILY